MLAAAVTAVVTASSPLIEEHSLAVAVQLLVAGTPMTAGLHLWHRRPDEALGPLLVVFGLVYCVRLLHASSEPAIFTLARAAVPIGEAALVGAVVTYAAGRSMSRRERALVWALPVGTLVLWLPALLVGDRIAMQGPLVPCEADCPDNLLAVADVPALHDGLVLSMLALAVVIDLGVALMLLRRIRDGRSLQRRMLRPLAVLWLCWPLSFAVALLAGYSGLDSVATPVGWIAVAVQAGVSLALVVGRRSMPAHLSGAIHRLVARLREQREPRELRDLLAQELDDPALELALPAADGGWVGAGGETLGAEAAGRTRTPVERNGQTIAMLVHDSLLSLEPARLESVGAVVAIGLEQAHHDAELRLLLAELHASRARVLRAGDAERRRIERDLHDGAQQRLVALRVRMSLVGQVENHADQQGMLAELGNEVDDALDELRELAQGIYPPMLSEYGLAEALRAAGRHALVSVSVYSDGVGRYDAELESAVYFCCVEALQNVDKHARGASEVLLRLRDDGSALSFEARDDGVGFDPRSVPRGRGLVNMSDRVASLGGRLEVVSAPGAGTVVEGSIPISSIPAEAPGRPDADPGWELPLQGTAHFPR